jgi:hypothetical protein
MKNGCGWGGLAAAGARFGPGSVPDPAVLVLDPAVLEKHPAVLGLGSSCIHLLGGVMGWGGGERQVS